MAADSNEQRYRRLIDEGFNKGNLAAVDELVSADLEEHEQLPPGMTPGREGLKTLITSMRTAFPDNKSTIEDFAVDGEKTWSRIVVRGTNTGPFMGMPPTGKRVTFEVMDLCRFAGGKVVEHWGVSDNFAMMQQLGAIPAPAESAQARQ
jgi:predicted ester cyclase